MKRSITVTEENGKITFECSGGERTWAIGALDTFKRALVLDALSDYREQVKPKTPAGKP